MSGVFRPIVMLLGFKESTLKCDQQNAEKIGTPKTLHLCFTFLLVFE